MKNTTNEDFTMMPHFWSRRKDVPLAKRAIVGYIYTRANIEQIEWELVGADVAYNCGLPKATVSKVMSGLEKQGVIQFTEWRKRDGDFPSKIYQINRVELEKLMTPPEDVVHSGNRHGSSCEPPRFIRRTATVLPVNLEEEGKEENEKKSLEKEKIPVQATETSSINQTPVPEPELPQVAQELPSKSSTEKLSWVDDIKLNKSKAKNSRAEKNVWWTGNFDDYFVKS